MTERPEFYPAPEVAPEEAQAISEVVETERIDLKTKLGQLREISRKTRSKLPRTAYLLQALLTVYLSTSEMASISSVDDFWKVKEGRSLDLLYHVRDTSDHEVNGAEAEKLLKDRERDEAKTMSEQLALLKAQGFNIQLEKEVLVESNFHNIYFDARVEPRSMELKFGDAENEKIKKEKKELLDASLPGPAWQVTDKDKDLDTQSKFTPYFFAHQPMVDEQISPRHPVLVRPLRVQVTSLSRDSYAVMASDLSDQKNPVFFYEEYNDRDIGSFQPVLGRMQTALTKRAAGLSTETIRAGIPDQEKKGILLQLEPESSVSPERRETIKQFFQTWDKVEIQIFDYYFELTMITLSDDQMKVSTVLKEKGLPIMAKGPLQITLHRIIKNQSPPANMSKDELLYGKFQAFHEKDKFGNKIETMQTISWGEGQKTVQIGETVTIEIPGFGIQEGAPVKIESRFLPDGLPFLDRDIDRSTIVQEQGFSFVHLDNLGLVKQLPGPVVDGIISGIRRAEKYFDERSQLVKWVLFINNTEKNAFFDEDETNAITLTGEIVRGSSGPEAQLVAGHETFHALAAKYGLNEKMQRIFFELGAGDFFHELDETQFYKGQDGDISGGHSEDDSAELVASFMSSMTHPHWQQAIESHSIWFQQQYLQLMLEFRNVIVGIKELEHSQVKKDLDDRIAYMEKHSAILNK